MKAFVVDNAYETKAKSARKILRLGLSCFRTKENDDVRYLEIDEDITCIYLSG